MIGWEADADAVKGSFPEFAIDTLFPGYSR